MVIKSNKSSLRARITKKLRKWNAKEKLKIIADYEQQKIGIKGFCKKINIQPQQLRDWMNKKDKLVKASPKTEKLHGKLPHYPEIESILFNWIMEQRQLQNPVTRKLITIKAFSLVQDTNFQNLPNIQSFKFSHTWFDGFLDHHNLSIRRRTTVSQKLPEDLEEQKQSFINYISGLCIRHNYPLCLIGNMDETPLTFDFPSPTTIEKRGTHTIGIRTTGLEKKKFYSYSWVLG